MNTLTKEADFGLSSIFDAAVQSIKGLIDPQHPVQSILQLLTEGVITKYFGLPWGIVSSVLDKGFGINIGSLFNTMKSVFSSHVASDPYAHSNPEAASQQMAQATVQKLNLPPDKANIPIDNVMKTEASLSVEYLILTKISNKSPEMIKTAALTSIFSLTGIIGFIFKALLTGAGLSLATGVVTNVLKPKTETPTEPGTKPAPQTEQPSQQAKNTILSRVGQASGQGEVYHNNDADENEQNGKESWRLQNKQGSFGDSIYDWIVAIYPNMNPKLLDFIDKNFDKAYIPFKREFSKWNPGENIDSSNTYVRIPSKYHTKKEVVDAFLSTFIIQ